MPKPAMTRSSSPKLGSYGKGPRRPALYTDQSGEKLPIGVIAAAVLSSSALGQTVSSGTSPSPELPSVSTETAAAAPVVSSTSVAAAPSISTETLTVSTTGQSATAVEVASSTLPGLATGYAIPSVSTAAPVETASGVVPRPWVIGDIKADGLKNIKLSTIRGAIKARKGDLYDRPDLDKDIQSLLGLGLFERVGAEITLLEKKVPEHFPKAAARPQILLNYIGEKPVVRKIPSGQKKVSGDPLGPPRGEDLRPLDRFKLEEAGNLGSTARKASSTPP